jgi:DNA-binding cell septation regulator SpoVG
LRDLPPFDFLNRVYTFLVSDAESQSNNKEQTVNLKVNAIQRSTKPHRLADATVELSDASGDSFVISDIRILQNKQGQAWVAMPSRSVSEGGRSFQYLPLMESSRQLHRRIEDAVLAAFEKWVQSQPETGVRS